MSRSAKGRVEAIFDLAMEVRRKHEEELQENQNAKLEDWRIGLSIEDSDSLFRTIPAHEDVLSGVITICGVQIKPFCCEEEIGAWKVGGYSPTWKCAPRRFSVGGVVVSTIEHPYRYSQGGGCAVCGQRRLQKLGG